MKKLISIFLILILSVLVTYGAEYEIKWKDGFDELHVRSVESDCIVITDGVFFRGLYDLDLNMISDGMYDFLTPLDNEGNFFKCSAKVSVYKSRKKGEDYTFTDNLIKGGARIVEDDEIFEQVKEYCDHYDIPYEDDVIVIQLSDLYDKNGNKLSRLTSFGFENQESMDNYNSGSGRRCFWHRLLAEKEKME